MLVGFLEARIGKKHFGVDTIAQNKRATLSNITHNNLENFPYSLKLKFKAFPVAKSQKRGLLLSHVKPSWKH